MATPATEPLTIDTRKRSPWPARWAHVRRKFHDALEQSPRTSAWLMRQLQHLHRIEAELREQRAGPGWRVAVRAHQSQPILTRLKNALLRLKASGRHLPQSQLGQAIDYTLGQWPTLEIFLNDGRVEIDNNLVENAIRPTAIGKKNWLFIGDAGARRTQRDYLQGHRKLPTAWNRSVCLPARRAHPPAEHDQPADPRSDPLKPGPKPAAPPHQPRHHRCRSSLTCDIYDSRKISWSSGAMGDAYL